MENSFFKENKLLILLIFLYLLNCFYYYPFVADDALISLRYSQRLIEGKGLTWNDGEFVEGFSNFLWVIAVSALGVLKIDLILSTRILGILSGFFTLILISHHFRNYRKEAVFLGSLFLVMSGSFSVWSIGGLEQPFVIFFLTGIILSTFKIIDDPNKIKNWNFLGIFGGLLAITRPDGILFIILSCVLLYLHFWKKHSKILNKESLLITISFAASLVFYISLLIFRIFYYGEFVPNTALVKAHFSVEHFVSGLKYLTNFTAYTFPLNIFIFWGLIRLIIAKKDSKAIYLLLLIFTWTGYIISVGGDFMPAFRLLEITVLLMSISIIYILEKFDFSNLRIYKPIVLVSLLIYAVIQMVSIHNQHAKHEKWEFTGMEIGKNLTKTFPKDATVAVTAAGSIPYSSEMRSIDMLGLNDYELARNPPKNFGKGKIGHELGNSKYLLRRKPDIIIFNMGDPNPDYPFAKELLHDKIFITDYVKNHFTLKNDPTPRALFLYKYGVAGVKYRENEIIIPHYLLNHKNPMESKNGKFISTFKDFTEITIADNSARNWEFKDKVNFKGSIEKTAEQIHLKIIPNQSFETAEIILVAKD